MGLSLEHYYLRPIVLADDRDHPGGIRLRERLACTVDELAVTDRNIITASGPGSVKFAREVICQLKLHEEANTQLWFDMFKTSVISEAFRSGKRSGDEVKQGSSCLLGKNSSSASLRDPNLAA